MLITILARLQKLLREIKLYITQKNRRLTVANKKTPLPFEQRRGHLLFSFSFGKLNRFALLGMRDGTLASKSNLVDARTTLTPNSISYLKTSKFWPIAGSFLFLVLLAWSGKYSAHLVFLSTWPLGAWWRLDFVLLYHFDLSSLPILSLLRRVDSLSFFFLVSLCKGFSLPETLVGSLSVF